MLILRQKRAATLEFKNGKNRKTTHPKCFSFILILFFFACLSSAKWHNCSENELGNCIFWQWIIDELNRTEEKYTTEKHFPVSSFSSFSLSTEKLERIWLMTKVMFLIENENLYLELLILVCYRLSQGNIFWALCNWKKGIDRSVLWSWQFVVYLMCLLNVPNNVYLLPTFIPTWNVYPFSLSFTFWFSHLYILLYFSISSSSQQ